MTWSRRLPDTYTGNEKKAVSVEGAHNQQKVVKTGPIKDPDRLFNNVAMDIGSKYKEVGVDLGLSYKRLENELDSGVLAMQPASKKAFKMLQLWKDSVAEEDSTYSKLAAALEKNDLNRCASMYCR